MIVSRQTRLRPCTIIPEDLYVERGADRQLARNISQMGRPAYVLVARQMGKTNLLLHAKRRALADDLFVYVDASNVVPDLRSFFRGMIDACVDELGDPVLQDSIDAGRSSPRAHLEHREHERELRSILEFIPGRLIIFLDEIDALTRVSYSDKVFSFIRSIYFSGRTNFKCFERISYVLSGVAEPSEIIRNRDISPFNIGEKIYLDDFSRSEFERFFDQAALFWPEDVKERIFYWTSGNPRLTWDLASAVEADGATVDAVDAAVQRLYLGSFDLPPVDHIRSLARANKEIRSAVMSIHYGRTDQVPDSTVARLYLAGIVSGAGQGADLRIKNRIIELSLSEKWLKDTDRSEVPSLTLASSLYDEGRYREAIDVYSALEKSGVVRDLELLAFRRAQCLYALEDYPAALIEIEKGIYPRSKSLDIYLASSALCGATQLLLGQVADSIVSFERVVREAVDNDLDQPVIITRSKIHLAAAYMSLENPDFGRARELSVSVVNSISSVAERDGAITQAGSDALTSAHFSVYRSFVGENNRGAAREHLQAAISRARPSERPTLMLEDIIEFEKGAEREATLSECARHCMDAWLPLLGVYNADRPLSFQYRHAAVLCLELALANTSSRTLSDFVEYCARPDVGHKVSVYKVLAHAGALGLSISNDRVEGAVRELFRMALKLEAADSDGSRLLAACLGTAYCTEFDLDAAAKVITEAAGKDSVDDRLYIYASHRIAWNYIEKEEFASALSILNSLPRLSGREAGGSLSAHDLFGDYFKLVAESRSEAGLDVSGIVQLYRSLSSHIRYEQGLYDPNDIEFVKSKLLDMFPEHLQPSMLMPSRLEYGRNQTVTVMDKSGLTRSVKYKKVESDIKSGVVTIVSVAR